MQLLLVFQYFLFASASATLPDIEPNDYDYSVWALQPTPKKLPTVTQLRTPSFKGAYLRNLDGFEPVRTDGDLLRQLRKHNPHLAFSHVSRRVDGSIRADEQRQIPLMNQLDLRMKIVERGREMFLRRRPSDSTNMHRQYLAYAQGKPLVELELAESGSVTHMVGPIPLYKPFFVTAALQYQAFVGRSVNPTAPVKFRVQQKPNYIVIVVVRPILRCTYSPTCQHRVRHFPSL